MSSDVHAISNVVAEELALEHCTFYADKTPEMVKGYFLNQIYRSWGLTAHRGWARLLLDRRCLVQIPNAPHHHTRMGDDRRTFLLRHGDSEKLSQKEINKRNKACRPRKGSNRRKQKELSTIAVKQR